MCRRWSLKRNELTSFSMAHARALVIGPLGTWGVDVESMVISMGCSEQNLLEVNEDARGMDHEGIIPRAIENKQEL